MIRYVAAAGSVVRVECHPSVLSMIRAVLLYVVELFKKNNQSNVDTMSPAQHA